MIYYMLNIVTSYCCFGKKKKLIEEIKEDIAFLTDKELNHLRAFLIRPMKREPYCC